jgi:hypothetical protein
MAQAFDKVWHQGFLFKLKSIFPPYYYQLFTSYLENRHLVVRFGSVLFVVNPIHAGIPQGSVAVPLLFNLYTSDQPTINRTITGDFFNDKAIMALNSEAEIASNLIQFHFNLLRPSIKTGESR